MEKITKEDTKIKGKLEFSHKIFILMIYINS